MWMAEKYHHPVPQSWHGRLPDLFLGGNQQTDEARCFITDLLKIQTSLVP